MFMQRISENLSEYQCWKYNQEIIQNAFKKLDKKIHSLIPYLNDDDTQLFQRNQFFDQEQIIQQQKQQIQNDNNKQKNKKHEYNQTNERSHFQKELILDDSEENESYHRKRSYKTRAKEIIQSESEESESIQNKRDSNESIENQFLDELEEKTKKIYL